MPNANTYRLKEPITANTSIKIPIYRWFALILMSIIASGLVLLFGDANDGLVLQILEFSSIIIGCAIAFPLVAMKKYTDQYEQAGGKRNDAFPKVAPALVVSIVYGFLCTGIASAFSSSYVLPLTKSKIEATVESIEIKGGLFLSEYQLEIDSNKHSVSRDYFSDGDSISLEERISLDGRISKIYVCKDGECLQSRNQ